MLFSELSTARNSRPLVCLIESGLTSGTYNVTAHVNFEFLPNEGLDYFNTCIAPQADPNDRLRLKDVPDSKLFNAQVQDSSNHLPALLKD